MRLLILPCIAFALPLASAPVAAQGRPPRASEGVTNLGFATDRDPDAVRLAVGPEGIAFGVGESIRGEDLNGDGDRQDGSVLHVRATGAPCSTNLGLAVSGVFLEGRDLALWVSEHEQGETDLNGDGDAEDDVLHLYDFFTGEVRNLGLAAQISFLPGKRALLTVSEAAQGSTDLNGDGDTLDSILHTYDLTTGTATNRHLHALGVRVSEHGVDVLASESGSVDLNGDGDVLDGVPQILDPGTGVVQNLGLAGTLPTRHGGYLVTRVSEWGQGHTDLNGDGDARDFVLFVVGTNNRRPVNTGLAGSELAASARSVLVGVPEASQGGADLNGDGDSLDEVLYLIDLPTGTATGLGTSHLPTWSSFSGQYGAVVVSEQDEGDLNGDGDAYDWILHVIDVQIGRLSNLGYHVTGGGITKPASLRGRYVEFLTREYSLGQDLNGDGDLRDEVAIYHDIRTGRTTTDGLIVLQHPTFLDERYAVLSVWEGYQGADLNGDGDTWDEVLYVRDAQREVTYNLGLASGKPDFYDDAAFVVDVHEFDQGNQDLNGDGDVLDRVLFAWTPEELVPRNLGHAVGYLVPQDCGGRGCPSFGPFPVLDGPRILFAVSERDDGDRDLNGDGYRASPVLHFVDLGTPGRRP